MAEGIVHYQACPLCSSQAIAFFCSALDHTVSKESFDIWRCDNCNFKFTQAVPNQASIGPYYQSEDYISHSNTKKGIINQLYHFARNVMMKQKSNLIIRYGRKHSSKKLLDIGCGTGYFLNTMQQHGCSVEGVEWDAKARQLAEQTIDKEIYTVENWMELNERSFSVISMWHVLEHIHDLDKYIEKINSLLVKDGNLVIAVPNANAYDNSHYKSFWAGWDVPRHLYHFAPNNLEAYLKTRGFMLEEKKGMPFDPFYISMLSEKYQGKKTFGFLIGGIKGAWFLLKSRFNRDKSSSIIYIFKKI